MHGGSLFCYPSAGYVKSPPDKAYIISGIRKNPRILVGRAGAGGMTGAGNMAGVGGSAAGSAGFAGQGSSDPLGTAQITGTLPIVMKQVFDTMSEATGVALPRS